MITFDYQGMPLTHQKVVPGNTITSLSSNCYFYQRWKLKFDDGDSAIAVGDWVVGATSTGVAKVVEVSVSGAWTDATGYLILDSWNGTAFQDNEELKVAAGATMANVDGILDPIESFYNFKGMQAKSALVCVYANTALVGIDGGKPDQTALIGIPMVANSSLLLKDIGAIKQFKCLDYTAASASILQITYFF